MDKRLYVAGDSHKQIDGNSNSEVKKDRNLAKERERLIEYVNNVNKEQIKVK